MDITTRDWIELIGVVILPIVGFVLSLILHSFRSQLKELQKTDGDLAAKIESLQKEYATWHAELPEKYARRDDLERTFNQLSSAILRVDEKLDRILHRNQQD